MVEDRKAAVETLGTPLPAVALQDRSIWTPSDNPEIDCVLTRIEEIMRGGAHAVHAQADRNISQTLLINKLLMQRHPDLFEFKYILKEIGNMPVKSFKLATRIHPEISLFDEGEAVRANFLHPFIDKIADEFHGFHIPLGHVRRWYWPVLTSGVMVDPESFDPVIGLMTRFAVTPRFAGDPLLKPI